MQYLNSLLFKKDILFEVSRPEHKKFKLKKELSYNIKYVYPSKKSPWKQTPVKVKRVDTYFKILHKGLNVEFSKDINILVGDNGCGKSSILSFLKFKPFEETLSSFVIDEDEDKKEERKIQHYHQYLESDNRKLIFSQSPEGILFMDGLHKDIIFEKIKDSIQEKTSSGALTFSEFGHAMFFNTNSNGEVILDVYNQLETIKNCIIILDEPETSLSLKSIVNLRELLLKLSENNQLIIATHHPYLISLVDEVYNVETKKMINSKKYLNQFMFYGSNK